MTDLGTLGGNSSVAYGINPAGQVVGASTTATAETHAVLWKTGVDSDLARVRPPEGTTTRGWMWRRPVGLRASCWDSETALWPIARAWLASPGRGWLPVAPLVLTSHGGLQPLVGEASRGPI